MTAPGAPPLRFGSARTVSEAGRQAASQIHRRGRDAARPRAAPCSAAGRLAWAGRKGGKHTKNGALPLGHAARLCASPTAPHHSLLHPPPPLSLLPPRLEQTARWTSSGARSGARACTCACTATSATLVATRRSLPSTSGPSQTTTRWAGLGCWAGLGRKSATVLVVVGRTSGHCLCLA